MQPPRLAENSRKCTARPGGQKGSEQKHARSPLVASPYRETRMLLALAAAVTGTTGAAAALAATAVAIAATVIATAGAAATRAGLVATTTATTNWSPE